MEFYESDLAAEILHQHQTCLEEVVVAEVEIAEAEEAEVHQEEVVEVDLEVSRRDNTIFRPRA